MAKVASQQDRPGLQMAFGVASVVGGLWLSVAIGAEAGVGNRIWLLLALATVAGGALAWLNEWVERGRSPKAIAAPAALLLSAGGVVLANTLSEDNQMWIGLGLYAVGISFIAIVTHRAGTKVDDGDAG